MHSTINIPSAFLGARSSARWRGHKIEQDTLSRRKSAPYSHVLQRRLTSLVDQDLWCKQNHSEWGLVNDPPEPAWLAVGRQGFHTCMIELYPSSGILPSRSTNPHSNKVKKEVLLHKEFWGLKRGNYIWASEWPGEASPPNSYSLLMYISVLLR